MLNLLVVFTIISATILSVAGNCSYEQITLTDKTERIALPTNDNFCIRQTGVDFHHESENSYTFFFPEIILECECTCDLYQPLQKCTINTNSRRNQCDEAQKTDITCSNLDYTGTKSDCPRFYRMCCQMSSSIRDPQDSRRAFQLKLSHLVTHLEITIETRNTNKTIALIIPNWVEKLIIGTDTMLAMKMSDSMNSPFNLNGQWMYYREETGKFYSGVYLNDRQQGRYVDIMKEGWFRKTKENKMARIDRTLIEDNSKMNDVKCDQHSPAFQWTLNATNYYYNKDLKSTTKEIPFKDDNFLVSVKEFFNGKPAFITKSYKTPPMTLLMLHNLDIIFSSTRTADTMSRNLTLNITTIQDGHFDVIVADNYYTQRVETFLINASSSFPYSLNATYPAYMNCKLVCIKKSEARMKSSVCVSIDSLIGPLLPVKQRPSTIHKQTTFTTINTETKNKNDSETNLLKILISILTVIIVAFGIICCCFKKKLSISKISLGIPFLSNYRQPTNTSINQPPTLNQSLEESLLPSTKTSPV